MEAPLPETLLSGNIVMSPPLVLRILVDPPVSPSGHPWQIELRADAGRDVVETEADAAGITESGGLAAGSWRLTIGSENVHRAYETELELRADRELLVEIPLVEVRGRVTMGGEPVTGGIVLSPGTGGGWGATLDEEGAFHTWMRKPEFAFLFATILGDDLPSVAKLTVEDFEVEDGAIELDLQLLNLEITGLVRNHLGAPVAGATVTALKGTVNRHRKRTGRDGSFAIHTFHAGEYRVRATHETQGTSREEVLVLGETFPTASVELVLRESRELSGRVIGPSGEAVGGAGVLALSAGTVWVEDNTSTDAEGRFTVEVAEDVDRVVKTPAKAPKVRRGATTNRPAVLKIASWWIALPGTRAAPAPRIAPAVARRSRNAASKTPAWSSPTARLRRIPPCGSRSARQSSSSARLRRQTGQPGPSLPLTRPENRFSRNGAPWRQGGHQGDGLGELSPNRPTNRNERSLL